MSHSLVFRPKAEADLSDIWDFTAGRWSIAQAEAYLNGINETLALLCAYPEIARLYDFAPPVRIFPYRSHLLIFVAAGESLDVIRILHMRANWQVLLTE